MENVDDDQRQNNRAILKKVIEIIKLLSRQNIPLRGHRDHGELAANRDINEGNFREFLRFQAFVLSDSTLRRHLENGAKNATFLSPDTQNEIITICGNIIQKTIVDRVNNAKSFSILADETTDASNAETLSLSVRFIEECKVYEYFLGFVQLTELTGKGIAEAILKYLKDVGLDLQYLRGQGYDGARAMSGVARGVQAVVKALYPKAEYVHCWAHVLNLGVSSASSTSCVSAAVELIKEITIYVTNSPKISELLKQNIREIQSLSDSGRSKLITFCATRWTERHRAIQRFEQLLVAVVKYFKQVASMPSIDRNKATFFLHNLLNYEFVFVLIMLNEFTSLLIGVSAQLQQVSVDLLVCHQKICSTIVTIKDAQTDRKLFDKIYNDTFSKVIDIGFLNENSSASEIAHLIPFDSTFQSPREYYFNTIYLPYLKELENQLHDRFNPHMKQLFYLQRFVPSYFTDDLSPIKTVFALYEDDLTCVSETEFMAEYRSWRSQFRDQEVVKPANALDALAVCNAKFEPNIYKVLQIFATLPVTTAMAERSFSTLRRLKTYLRSTMTGDRLTALALLNIHETMEVDTDEVVSIYKLKNRRIKL